MGIKIYKWLPTDLWKEKKYFNEMIDSEKMKVNIKLTPYFNLHKRQGLIKSEFGYIEIPISNITKNGKRRFFLNGKIIADKNRQENIDLIYKIRNSLENNSTNINIEQNNFL